MLGGRNQSQSCRGFEMSGAGQGEKKERNDLHSCDAFVNDGSWTRISVLGCELRLGREKPELKNDVLYAFKEEAGRKRYVPCMMSLPDR